MMTTLRALLLGMVAFVYAADPLPTWTMSDAERREIETLADQAVAMGMPDTSHAELYVGTLTVTWPKADGSGEEQRNFQGIHAKQPDGTWVPWLFQRLADIKDLTIQRNGLKPIAAQDLPALARKTHGDWRYWVHDPMNLWSPHYSPESLAMIHGVDSGIDMLAINQQNYGNGINPSSMKAAVCVALMRQQVPGATACAAGIGVEEFPMDSKSLQRRSASSLLLWSVNYWDETSREAPITLPGPLAIFRYGIRAWYLDQIQDLPLPFAPLATDRAEAALRTLTPIDDHDAQQKIANLLTRLTLPTSTSPQADLATRLVNWRVSSVRAYFWQGEDALPVCAVKATRDAKIMDQWQPEQRQLVKELMATSFKAEDLDALMSLVGDCRLSRWLEGDTPRTVGDQALRAIANVMWCDPRLFIDRDLNAPWTDDERAAVATALQTWWAANRKRPLSDLRLEIIAKMQSSSASDLIACTPAGAEQTRLLDRLAAAWIITPPVIRNTGLVGSMFRWTANHPALAKTIDGWPVEGSLRNLLAAWHLHRGDPKPVDTIIAELMATETVDIKHNHWLFRRATPAVLARLQTVAAGDMTTKWWKVVLMYVNDGPVYFSLPSILQSKLKNGDTSAAVRTALMGQLLSDQRPLPAWMQARVRNYSGGDRDRTLPDDLRVCDGVASIARNLAWQLPRDDFNGREQDDLSKRLIFDPYAPLVERNAALKRVSSALAEILPELLTKAKLPLSVPGLTLKKSINEEIPVPF